MHATSMVLRGAALPAVTVVSLVLLKKHSQIRTDQCRPAPHRCGDREAYQVDGLTDAASSNHRVPNLNGKSRCMVRLTSLMARSSMDASFSRQPSRRLRAAVQTRPAATPERKTSPHDHSTQKSRAHWEQSDHSRNS